MSVTVQWIQGQTGTGSTYTFKPKPSFTRNSPGQKTSVLEVPKMDGSIVQQLGLMARNIQVKGIITVYPPNYDNLMEAKKALEDAIGTGVGQLHLISNSGQANAKHIYYIGILDGELQWSEQTNMAFLEYGFTILCADPTEYTYVPPVP